MNRFRKYILIAFSGIKGVRLIMREKDNPIADYPPIIKYRIQLHKRFLGINYWRTFIKTTSFQVAIGAYDLSCARR